MKKSIVVALIALLALPGLTQADDVAELKQFLITNLPDRQPDSIKPSPIPGLYEVAYGSDVFYSTSDGHYLVRGDLFDVLQHQNLSEAKRSAGRLKEINAIGEKNMIIYAPQQVKHTLTVFYDVDCPYCRKMQNDIPELNSHGIKVRYLAYPRTGLDTDSFKKAVSVWCAEDRNKALAIAEKDEPLDEKTCANPVKQTYDLGNRFRIGGTPTLVLENGELVNGYKEPGELVGLLEAPAELNPLQGP